MTDIDKDKRKRKRDWVKRRMERAKRTFLSFNDPMDRLKRKVRRHKKDEPTKNKGNKD